jgi:cytochrome P450
MLSGGLVKIWLTSCTVILVSTFLVTIICSLQKYVTKLWTFRKFRGPYALPVIGNCYNLNSFSLFRYMADQKRKFGKTFLLNLFHKTYLVTMEPAVLRKFLTDTKSFVKCENYRHLSSLVLGDSLATSAHESHRQIFSQYFSLPNVSSSLALFQQITHDTTLELIPAHLTSDFSMDIQLFFSRLSLRLFLHYFMGYSHKQKGVREVEVWRPQLLLKPSLTSSDLPCDF